MGESEQGVREGYDYAWEVVGDTMLAAGMRADDDASGLPERVGLLRALCPFCSHEWRRHDPVDGRCDAHSRTTFGPCECGRSLVWMQRNIARLSSDALNQSSTARGDA